VLDATRQPQDIPYDSGPMQSSPLHYAPAAPGRAKRKARRLTVVVAVSALFLALCWGAWTGYLRDRIAYGRLWHRSENFAEPPTTPVYTTDPTLMPQLFSAGYLPSNWRTPAGPIAAWRRPTTWMELGGKLGVNS